MIRRPAGLLAFVLLVAAFAGGGAAAQNGRPYEARYDIPARPTPPRLVNDFTGTLAGGEVAALEQKLVAFADTAGSQVAVVLVPSTDGVPPSDYATDVLRAWGVGRAGENDGVVLLVAVQDREVFIATGYGAETALTDAIASGIVRNVIVPEFRRGAFYAGLDAATDAIVGALSGQFSDPSDAAPDRDGGAIVSVLAFLFILFVVLVIISSRHAPPPSGGSSGRGGGSRRRRSGPGVVVLPGFGWGGGGGFGNSGGFGGGGFGGGGFGGFGGGFGGGGGAGGSW